MPRFYPGLIKSKCQWVGRMGISDSQKPWNGVVAEISIAKSWGECSIKQKGYRSSGNVCYRCWDPRWRHITQVTVEKGYIQAPKSMCHVVPAPSNTQLRQFNGKLTPLSMSLRPLCVLGSLFINRNDQGAPFRSLTVWTSQRNTSLHCIIPPEVDLRSITWLALLHFQLPHQQCRHPFYTTECFLCKFCPVAQ